MAETRQRVLHDHVNLSKKFVQLFKVNNSCRRLHHLLQLMRNSLKVIEVHLFCFETTFTKKKGGGKKRDCLFFAEVFIQSHLILAPADSLAIIIARTLYSTS